MTSLKVCLQAGHKNMVSGSTGAPGEREWTTKIADMVAEKLRKSGIEVYVTDAFGNKDSKVTKTDWDLFLAIHYDADIYWIDPKDHSKGTERGGFTDYPDASIDDVNSRSKELSEKIAEDFFDNVHIPYKSRSNANTKFYYMWQFLSSKTPCVLIECGVGNRRPEDYETLRRYEEISQALAGAIMYAIGVIDPKDSIINKLSEENKQLLEEIKDIRSNRDKYRSLAKEQDKEIKRLQSRLEDVIKNSNKLELIKAIILGK